MHIYGEGFIEEFIYLPDELIILVRNPFILTAHSNAFQIERLNCICHIQLEVGPYIVVPLPPLKAQCA